MIVNKCLANSLFKECLKAVCLTQKANIHNRTRIGNREWVAFGRNGSPSYFDDPTWPCPAIRFKENNNELLALREKEKGDWRKLTVDEKKILYRASFRQTLVEVGAPTGQWKSVMGACFAIFSISLWLYILIKLFLNPPLPESFSDAWKRASLRKKIELKDGHLSGIASKWDYEKDDWKK